MKKNLIVGQSGGPTAVINSSLYGVISEAFQSSDTIDNIYGMENGIEGFLKGSIIDITHKISNEELEAIKTTPGAYLGSCRYKLPEDLEDEVYSKLFTAFEKLNIGYFLYIGGNDSMDTVSKLARYADSINSTIRIIGIPKTIDNDLVHTDHTPGYGSAAKFVAYSVREIALDASIYDTKSVTIVEIMGRNAGWLTAASVLARKHENDNPVLIYLPETDFNKEAFISQLNQHLEVTNNLVVCVSEGLHD
ncbi:6-phosphofructokinase, partial [Lachnotalea glycerini]